MTAPLHCPPDLKTLQELVELLHAQGSPWLPAGLGSRLDWGAAPLGGGDPLISTRALSGLVEHNPGDFTVTVRAGTPLLELQQQLAAERQWLAVDWPWGSGPEGEGSGTVGGLVARGLSGGYRQRYLGVRDQLIGIELMRADGVVARAGGRVVKNVAGYDLMRLLTGSWGSLALITGLTLRTLPLPPLRRALLLQGPGAALASLSRWLLHSSLSPERIDLWSPELAKAAGQGEQPLLLVALASISAQTLEEQIRCIGEQAAALADVTSTGLKTEAGQALLAWERGQPQPQAADWLLRLALPPQRAADLMAGPELIGLRASLSAGTGLGMAWAAASELPIYRVEALRRRCSALGGVLTLLRQPAPSRMAAWEDAPSRPLIEAIKRQFDPKQQLARGRLPGVRPSLPPGSASRSLH